MEAPMEKEWTLRELAAEAGVPERTIRFYISRGLLDPPLRGGRGAAYGEKHKQGIEAIRRLQAQGLMLSEIAFALHSSRADHSAEEAEAGEPTIAFKSLRDIDASKPRTAAPAPAPSLPEPAVWRAYSVADDVVVMLRAEAGPWRTRRVLSALSQFAKMIDFDMNNNNKGEKDE
jgi:DNA-binding transcriptional MerR regulator